VKYKPNKDTKVRIILTALYNANELIEHPLGAGARKQYNKYMRLPMNQIDGEYKLAMKIIQAKSK